MHLAVPWRAIVLALCIHSLWGGNPIALKFALPVFPPMWSAFWRFVIGAACVLAWALWTRTRVMPTRDEWPLLAGIGVLFCVQIGTMNVGTNLSTGAMGAVVMATNPLFAAAFAHFLLAGDRIQPVRLAGLLVAFAGTALVVARGVDVRTLALGGLGNYLLLFSAALLGLRLALSARALERMDEVRVALWQMLLALPIFALAGLRVEEIAWHALNWQALAGLAYQGFIVAGLAFMVNFYLMKRYTPSIMMSFNFVSPVVGVSASVWLLGERVGAELMLGLLLVTCGLLLVTRARSSEPQPTAA